MSRNHKTFSIIAFACLILLASTYKLLIAHEIKVLFQKNGLDTITLHVDSANFTSAHFTSITMGDNKPLTIAEGTLEYTLSGLWKNHIDTIVLNNVAIEGDVVNGSLSLHGLDSIIREWIPDESPVFMPDYFFKQAPFFFDSLTANNATLHVDGDGIDATIPFALTLRNGDEPSITLDSAAISGTFAGYSLSGEIFSGEAHFTKAYQWTGQWKIAGEALAGTGTIAINPAQFNMGFNVTLPSKTADATGTLHIQDKKTSITFEKAYFAWANGIISMHNATIPLYSKFTSTLPITLTHVAMDELCSLLGADATGSGTFSGTASFGYTDPSYIMVYQALLTSDAPGTVAIPQTSTKRSYEHIMLRVENNHSNALSLNLVLKGDNSKTKNKPPLLVPIKEKINLLNINEKQLPIPTEPEKIPAEKMK